MGLVLMGLRPVTPLQYLPPVPAVAALLVLWPGRHATRAHVGRLLRAE